MLIAKSDLELLPAVLILLWPLRIVFPRALLSKFAKQEDDQIVLHDFAVLDDSLNLRNHERAHAH